MLPSAPKMERHLATPRNLVSRPRETGTRPGSHSEICFLRATDLAAMIREKKLSAREVMEVHLRQIERVNPKVNAIVTLVDEDRLMAQARAADEIIAKGKPLGPLHGLPVAVKDLTETMGIRTTYGSPLYRDYVPDHDALVVERMKNSGAIVLGKTNTPECGMGSHTFNPVFGATLNPYDATKTCGGSTGGGAVALACGMAPVASGTDIGGSLRNPANFCNVVGIRPSPGRVPNGPSTQLGWSTLGVSGPMARNVTDCALLLGVLAGFDRRSPISIEQSGSQFLHPLGGRDFKGVRIAMIKDLGLPWEPEVMAAFHAQRKIFESLGCIVEEAEPEMQDAKRTALYQRMRRFMEEYEFLALPVNQVLPFDINVRYPAEIAGVKMENYIAWMKSTYYISIIGNPALSVPCAFSESGLPIGIQIVGRHHDDWGVLQLGYAFEQATNIGERHPEVV